MIIKYEEFGDYEYEVDQTELEKAVVEILCRNVKNKEKSLYNDDGAYQMAMYVVHDLDLMDELAENLESELHDWFYDKAQTQKEEGEEIAREEEDWYGTRSDIQ